MTTVIKSQTCTKSVGDSEKAGDWLFKLYFLTGWLEYHYIT